MRDRAHGRRPPQNLSSQPAEGAPFAVSQDMITRSVTGFTQKRATIVISVNFVVGFYCILCGLLSISDLQQPHTTPGFSLRFLARPLGRPPLNPVHTRRHGGHVGRGRRIIPTPARLCQARPHARKLPTIRLTDHPAIRPKRVSPSARTTARRRGFSSTARRWGRCRGADIPALSAGRTKIVRPHRTMVPT